MLTVLCCLSLTACGNSRRKKTQPQELTTMEKMQTTEADEATTEETKSSTQERVLFHVSTSSLSLDTDRVANTINQLSSRECTYVQTEWSESGKVLTRMVHVMPDSGISCTKWYDSDGTGYGVMVKDGIRYLTIQNGASSLYYKNAVSETEEPEMDIFSFGTVSADTVQPRGTAVYHGQTCKLAADITPERLSGGKKPLVYLINETGVIVGFTTDLEEVQYEDQITDVRNALPDDNLNTDMEYKESKPEFMDSEIEKMKTQLLAVFPAMEKRLEEGQITEETETVDETQSGTGIDDGTDSVSGNEDGLVNDIGDNPDGLSTEDTDDGDGIIVESVE